MVLLLFELFAISRLIDVDGNEHIALGGRGLHESGSCNSIVGKAAQILKRDGGRYALATQCIGGGQGIATVLEAVA